MQSRDDPLPSLTVPPLNTFLRSGTRWRDDTETQTGRNVCRDSLVTHYLLSCHAALHLLLWGGHFSLAGEGGRGRGFVVRMKSRGCSPFISLFSLKPPQSVPPHSLVVPNVFPVQGKDLFPHCGTSHRHTPGKHALLSADLLLHSGLIIN